MIKRDDESRDSDEAIWDDATTLSPSDTKGAKIHVTLRLDANVYRAIVAEKKAMQDRTITATIERLLNKGLKDHGDMAGANYRTMIRNIIAHNIAQDAVLAMLTRHVKPRSPQDKHLFELCKKYRWEPIDVKQWLLDTPVSSGREASYQELMLLLETIPPDTVKKPRRELKKTSKSSGSGSRKDSLVRKA